MHNTDWLLFDIKANAELQRLRTLVDVSRTRLAELEAAFTVEKAKVDTMKARLFAVLREHFQRRDRLRIVISYRRKYLESLVQQGEEDGEKIEHEFRQASAQSEQDYEETAAAMAQKKELSADEATEVHKLWRTLVLLYHPDRFMHEPEKQETYAKLTAAINHARGNGDLATLRKIAEDPHDFILRQGWAALDFRDEEQINRLQQLSESIDLEIIRVLEAIDQLKESPDYELYNLSQQDASILDTVTEKQKQDIEAECDELTDEAHKLEKQIQELTGEPTFGRADV